MKLLKEKYLNEFGYSIEKENLTFNVKKDFSEKLDKNKLILKWINQANKKFLSKEFNKVLFDKGYNYFLPFAEMFLNNQSFYLCNFNVLDDIMSDFIIYDFTNKSTDLYG